MKGMMVLVALAALCIGLMILLWPAAEGSQIKGEVELLRASGEATRVAVDNEKRQIQAERERVELQIARDTAPVRAALTAVPFWFIVNRAFRYRGGGAAMGWTILLLAGVGVYLATQAAMMGR